MIGILHRFHYHQEKNEKIKKKNYIPEFIIQPQDELV